MIVTMEVICIPQLSQIVYFWLIHFLTSGFSLDLLFDLHSQDNFYLSTGAGKVVM